MSGPQQQRLANYVDTAQLGQIRASKQAWKDGADRLRAVHERLLAAIPKVKEGVRTQTGNAAMVSMQATANRALSRAAEMDAAAKALDEVIEELNKADATLTNMRQNPLSEPGPLNTPVDATPQEALDAERKHNSEMSTYNTNVGNREDAARLAAEKVDQQMQAAAEVLAGIHGVEQSESIDFQSTGTSSQSGYFQDVGVSGKPTDPDSHGEVTGRPPKHTVVQTNPETSHPPTRHPTNVPTGHPSVEPSGFRPPQIHQVNGQTANIVGGDGSPLGYNPQATGAMMQSGCTPGVEGADLGTSAISASSMGGLGQVAGGVGAVGIGAASLKGLLGRIAGPAVSPASVSMTTPGSVTGGSTGSSGAAGARTAAGGMGRGPMAGGMAAGARGGAGAGGRRGTKRRKNGAAATALTDDGEHWIDDDDAAPGVLD